MKPGRPPKRSYGGIQFTFEWPYWISKEGITLHCASAFAGRLSAHWQAMYQGITVAGMTPEEVLKELAKKRQKEIQTIGS
jgi:hypothetical protein